MLVGSCLVASTIVLSLIAHYRGERYEIVQAVFIVTTNIQTLNQPAALCYSNKELRDAAMLFEGLNLVDMKTVDLDGSHYMACIGPNHTVDKVVGRQDFGLIILHKSTTNGVSFTLFKGTKRFLQFNYETVSK